MPFKGKNRVSSQQCSLPTMFHDNKVLDELCANHTSLNGSYFPYDLRFHVSADLSSFLPLATILTTCLLVLASLQIINEFLIQLMGTRGNTLFKDAVQGIILVRGR